MGWVNLWGFHLRSANSGEVVEAFCQPTKPSVHLSNRLRLILTKQEQLEKKKKKKTLEDTFRSPSDGEPGASISLTGDQEQNLKRLFCVGRMPGSLLM